MRRGLDALGVILLLVFWLEKGLFKVCVKEVKKLYLVMGIGGILENIMTVMFVLALELCERVRCSLCSRISLIVMGMKPPYPERFLAFNLTTILSFLYLFNPIKYSSYK